MIIINQRMQSLLFLLAFVDADRFGYKTNWK